MGRSYTYTHRTGVVYKKIINAKKTLFGVVATLSMAGAMAVPALAASNDYCSQQGCMESQSHTACAGHGAFSAFGKDNSWAGGASGDHTAYNNSTLCGNPSPNSSAATLGDHNN